MPSMNRVFLMGNLTRDPETRKLPSGQQVTELGLAINRKYRTSAGEDREDTCFVDINVWGKQAESCAEYLKQGSPVLVEGSLRYDQWESQGEKRSKLRVTADRVQFLRGGSQDDGQRQSKPPKPPGPPTEPTGPGPGGGDDNRKQFDDEDSDITSPF